MALPEAEVYQVAAAWPGKWEKAVFQQVVKAVMEGLPARAGLEDKAVAVMSGMNLPVNAYVRQAMFTAITVVTEVTAFGSSADAVPVTIDTNTAVTIAINTMKNGILLITAAVITPKDTRSAPAVKRHI